MRGFVRFGILLGVLALLAAVGLTQAPAQGEKYALLIGVGDYKGFFRDLPFAEADLRDLATVLEQRGYRRRNIRFLTQAGNAGKPAEPTQANIRAVVQEWLRNRTAGDQMLVAFSGHGVQFSGDKESYFCPAGAKLSVRSTLLPMSWVYEQLQACKAGFRLLLADACRNDPLLDQSRGAGQRRPVVKLKSEFRPETTGEGGVVAVFSCSAGQKAFSHDVLGHSVFYHFLIAGLDGKADLNRDGKITLGELLDYVEDAVPDYVQSRFGVKQVPEVRGQSRGSIALAYLRKGKTGPRSATVPGSGARAGEDVGLPLKSIPEDQEIWAVALSPDGLAATAAADGVISLWDTATGKRLRRFIGHHGVVITVAFSKDGRQMISGGQDRTVRVWNVATGAELQCLKGHKQEVSGVAFAPNSNYNFAVSGSLDKDIVLWDLNTGQESWRFSGHDKGVAAVAVSPDGWYILSGGLDHTVRYWSIDGAKLLWKSEAAHGGSVFAVAISPDGKLGVSGSGDRHLRIWDLKTGKEQPRRFVHPNAIRAVAFTLDGGHVVSACLDGVIRVWSLETGGLVRSFYGHEELARAVAVSSDGALALSGGLDRHAYLWSLSHLDAHPPRTRVEERAQVNKASGGKSARADLQVSVRWNTGCDVDLHVFEPNAQECCWRNVRTLNGGVFSKEARSEPGFGPELYQIVNAVPGEYLIRVDLLKSANGAPAQPTDVAVEVRRNAGGGREQTERFNVRLESAGHYSRVCSVRFGEEGSSIQPILSSNASLDIDLPSSAGSVTLKSGFLPDPFMTQLEAGGIIQSKRGGIAAWVNRAPHFKLQYRAGKYALSFYVKSRADTMLLVNLPDGTWIADDDSGGGSNPLLRLARPQSGRYDIYVGTYKKDAAPATLYITERK